MNYILNIPDIYYLCCIHPTIAKYENTIHFFKECTRYYMSSSYEEIITYYVGNADRIKKHLNEYDFFLIKLEVDRDLVNLSLEENIISIVDRNIGSVDINFNIITICKLKEDITQKFKEDLIFI